MARQEIFLDLDDTLWKASKTGSTAEMWNRLPAAMNSYFLGKADEIDWEKHKGSTDFALLYSIMKSAPREVGRGRDWIEMVQDVMSLMWAYYVRMSPESIRDALFSDTEEVLLALNQRYKFGIVSGNDGTPWYQQNGVGDHKLVQAGLTQYFPDPSMKFWGGDPSLPRRQNLLLAAYNKSLFDSDGKRTPFRYVADSNGDFDGIWGMVRDYDKPIDVRFGWVTRGRGAMERAVNHMMDYHELSPNVDLAYFDKYGYYDAGAMFNIDMGRSDKTFKVHLAPTLTALLNPGGLLI